jgi:hypothetical protein
MHVNRAIIGFRRADKLKEEVNKTSKQVVSATKSAAKSLMGFIRKGAKDEDKERERGKTYGTMSTSGGWSLLLHRIRGKKKKNTAPLRVHVVQGGGLLLPSRTPTSIPLTLTLSLPLLTQKKCGARFRDHLGREVHRLLVPHPLTAAGRTDFPSPALVPGHGLYCCVHVWVSVLAREREREKDRGQVRVHIN